MHDDDFDLESLKLPDDAVAAVVAKMPGNGKLRRQRQPFIMTPVEWADRLDGARYTATWRVAMHLLRRSFKDRRQTIRLANGTLAPKGVSPKQKWRALGELERLGLIRVKHRERKSPDVTLLYPTAAMDGG
jgi:hypothetical protein